MQTVVTQLSPEPGTDMYWSEWLVVEHPEKNFEQIEADLSKLELDIEVVLNTDGYAKDALPEYLAKVLMMLRDICPKYTGRLASYAFYGA